MQYIITSSRGSGKTSYILYMLNHIKKLFCPFNKKSNKIINDNKEKLLEELKQINYIDMYDINRHNDRIFISKRLKTPILNKKTNSYIFNNFRFHLAFCPECHNYKKYSKEYKHHICNCNSECLSRFEKNIKDCRCHNCIVKKYN
jgi:hypothetical protein